MTPFQRVLREPALIIGLVTAAIGLAVAFGVNITDDQAAALLIFVGALVALLRFVVTPAAEVVAQQKPDGPVVAGPASVVADGTPVAVVPTS